MLAYVESWSEHPSGLKQHWAVLPISLNQAGHTFLHAFAAQAQYSSSVKGDQANTVESHHKLGVYCPPFLMIVHDSCLGPSIAGTTQHSPFFRFFSTQHSLGVDINQSQERPIIILPLACLPEVLLPQVHTFHVFNEPATRGPNQVSCLVYGLHQVMTTHRPQIFRALHLQPNLNHPYMAPMMFDVGDLQVTCDEQQGAHVSTHQQLCCMHAIIWVS